MTDLLTGRRILAVEDEMLVLMNIETALKDFGCSTICSASSVVEALALLARQSFDAAILDVNLGGEKSYQVADALVRLGVPFVFSTGYSDHGVRIDLEDRPVLRKPYTRAALYAAFARLIPDAPLPAAA
ncbi:response regulator [Sphingomonas sp. RB3P16]|uniref:response regulator n=1 Tax=Parasphingomonas frigoris TaxID=3096163 RepID=UPI002FC5AB35